MQAQLAAAKPAGSAPSPDAVMGSQGGPLASKAPAKTAASSFIQTVFGETAMSGYSALDRAESAMSLMQMEMEFPTELAVAADDDDDEDDGSHGTTDPDDPAVTGVKHASRKCVRRVCKCSNGVAADGVSCPENGMERCVACEVGFRMGNGTAPGERTCIQNTCTCSNKDMTGEVGKI